MLMSKEEMNTAEWLAFSKAAKYTLQQVQELGDEGKAFKNPDGHYSYPIADAEDLGRAIMAVGRANASHNGIRRYIIGRAKDLGLSSQIPPTWSTNGQTSGGAGN